MFYIDNKLVLKKYIPSQLRGMLRSERLFINYLARSPT